MPDSNQILNEIRAAGSTSDVIRRRYLEKLHQLTKRNVIIYYSGWLQKQQIKGSPISITDADMSGFMTVSHQLDRKKGLDLILHTPGGELGAAEALVNYLQINVQYGYPGFRTAASYVCRNDDCLCLQRNYHGKTF
jgi:ClpP class serine protease